jgi:nicotinamidase-related amidase
MAEEQWVPGSYEEMVDPRSSALIMWDFQVGLGGRAVDLDRIVAAARRLLRAADAAQVPVIWSRHTIPHLSQVTPGSLYRMMKKQGVASAADLEPTMHEGSPDRDFIPQLQPRDHDTIIDKSTPNFFVGTPLGLRLSALGVRTLVFSGVTTEIGIDLTAKHAFALGFYPVVVEDAVGSYSVERHTSGLAALRIWVPVMTAADVVAVWEAAPRD